MRTLRMLALFVMIVSALQGVNAETFEKVVGRDRVREIVREVTDTVIKQQAAVYRRRITAADGYVDGVSIIAGGVETKLDRLAAEWRLRGLYGVFLSHLVAHLDREKHEGDIVLDSRAVKAYIVRARELGRCGEIPCPNECKPCDKECDRCP